MKKILFFITLLLLVLGSGQVIAEEKERLPVDQNHRELPADFFDMFYTGD